MRELNERQKRFVIEYLVDFNGTQAAIRAGYSERSASELSFALLQIPSVMQAVTDLQEERAARAELTADWVLRQWKQIAEADPNELIYSRLECCRYCYGVNHAYQWTEPEFRETLLTSGLHFCGRGCKPGCKLMLPPDGSGGFGFDSRKRPAEDCPQCHGEGVEVVKVADTRHVKGSARRLYAGIKKTKDGIEIKMRDQDKALQNIADYLGMLVRKNEISGPNGSPIPIATFNADDLTDDQLAQIIASESNLTSRPAAG